MPETKQRAPRKRARPAPVVAHLLPVARVAVDVSLAHLDRPFDYLVPERMAAAAVPGCRVRVRFAGQLVDGFLLAREAASEHQGRLAFLERVISPEPVLTPEIAGLARAVADRYAGTLADVLRLAVPPRHAAAEARQAAPDAGGPPQDAPPGNASPGDASPGDASPGDASPGDASPGDASARDASAGDASARDASAGDASPGDTSAGGAPPGAAPPGDTSAGDAPPGEGPRGDGPPQDLPAGGRPPPAPRIPRPAPGPWARYQAGEAFLAAIADGRAPRAAWSALPGPQWAEEIARAAATAASAGRGALMVVPDTRDLGQLDQALTTLLGPGRHVCLSAGLGPAERYRRWLSVLRGEVTIVAGLRAAMFAPVRRLGLVAVWDDGDDLHCEPRAPYPHAREVLALRAHRGQTAALIGGFARTAEVTQLVAAGWAQPLVGRRQTVRGLAPLARGTGDDSELARDQAATAARLPSLALRTARGALSRGPVLVQVPRRGYLPAVACARCREQARCATCGGPLAMPATGAAAHCPWCAALIPDWRCPRCGHTGLRSLATGAARTAEELGRAFPSVPVRTSRGESVLASVPATPAIVVCTPGAEPTVPGGYAAALLLDGRALLGRASLRAAEEALRRWLNAAALVRPASAGGRVVVMADASLPAVQALIRWNPVAFAEREVAERAELRFPPSARMAVASGPRGAVAELLAATELPPAADVLGPVDVAPADGDGDDVRTFIRVPRQAGTELARALQAAQAVRSARKAAGAVRLQMDPPDLM